mmetsp:Transcript_17074/g.41687  ORF Transcript_17074/g.41687 Transcript_17074/m.41687 type:complete len:263 (-) Transcript_17074:243-1031(-)
MQRARGCRWRTRSRRASPRAWLSSPSDSARSTSRGSASPCPRGPRWCPWARSLPTRRRTRSSGGPPRGRRASCTHSASCPRARRRGWRRRACMSTCYAASPVRREVTRYSRWRSCGARHGRTCGAATTRSWTQTSSVWGTRSPLGLSTWCEREMTLITSLSGSGSRCLISSSGTLTCRLRLRRSRATSLWTCRSFASSHRRVCTRPRSAPSPPPTRDRPAELKPRRQTLLLQEHYLRALSPIRGHFLTRGREHPQILRVSRA